MSWIFLTKNKGEREAMDIAIHHNKKIPQLDSGLDTFIDLIDSIGEPQGLHKNKTILFSISLPKLRELQSLALESTNYDYEPAEYRVPAIVLDTGPIQVVQTCPQESPKRRCQDTFHQT